VAVRALDDVIALHTLRFHDEVVGADELDLGKPSKKPSKREVEMAGKLVDTLAEDFDATAWEDTYRDSVLALIKRKAKGEEIDLSAAEEPEQGDNLMAALEASVSGGR
jgi:DNA end-binding protein Ku